MIKIKIIASSKVKKETLIIVIMILLIALLFNIIINFVDIKYVATSLNINKYEIRSNLLIDAMDNVGVCVPEDAVTIWSNGLKMRNAAMQYSVMTKELKTEYKAQLETSFPNWVTGISSPWIDSFKINETEKINENCFEFQIQFITKTSTGSAGNYKAKLTVIKDHNFWRISKILMDNELYPYTGFKP